MPTEHNGDGTHISSEDWIAVSFENSWVNYGGGYAAAEYYKDYDGVVHLKGMIKNGTRNVTAFTLPTDYRPVDRRLFGTISSAALPAIDVGRIDITSAGAVIPIIAVGYTWVSLDGLQFRTS